LSEHSDGVGASVVEDDGQDLPEVVGIDKSVECWDGKLNVDFVAVDDSTDDTPERRRRGMT
jgi:hypothetical protein